MKSPTVSILIPTYNYARHLPAAIESVLDQDFLDFELLIADDASTDNTEEICREYEAKDSRIRFFCHAENLGMVENWNWCLQQARGTSRHSVGNGSGRLRNGSTGIPGRYFSFKPQKKGTSLN
jgi:glycosyltransferase involved in cell wall biosynthesis